MGFMFLWPFFDKMFGLGYATPAARAWVNGGTPAQGFMKNAEGPFGEFFGNIAGPWADWLFMAGLARHRHRPHRRRRPQDRRLDRCAAPLPHVPGRSSPSAPRV